MHGRKVALTSPRFACCFQLLISKGEKSSSIIFISTASSPSPAPSPQLPQDTNCPYLGPVSTLALSLFMGSWGFPIGQHRSYAGSRGEGSGATWQTGTLDYCRARKGPSPRVKWFYSLYFILGSFILLSITAHSSCVSYLFNSKHLEGMYLSIL